jgi:hypothetical protein
MSRIFAGTGGGAAGTLTSYFPESGSNGGGGGGGFAFAFRGMGGNSDEFAAVHGSGGGAGGGGGAEANGDAGSTEVAAVVREQRIPAMAAVVST